MKIKLIVCVALAAALAAGCASEKRGEWRHHQKGEKGEWQSKAKVSKADAEQTALAKVPDGTIKEAELEKEHGKLFWSFDMATPGARDITEVHVDARTGAVVSVSKEWPEQENREAAEERDTD